MFDFDWFREVASTIKKNKARTFLTGVAVAWGILMLIVLLGAGNGLKNGIQSNFSGRAQNTVTLWPGWTSVPYKGMSAVRRIKFDDKVYNYISNDLPNVEYISARVSRNVTLTYGNQYGAWNLNGVSPDASKIFQIKINKGRFINDIDIKQRRKVVIINDDIAQVLFPNEDPMGKFVIADNLTYQVVGLYEDEEGWSNPPAYIPFTTAQTLYSFGYGFQQIDFTVRNLNTKKENDLFITELREALGKMQYFEPTDLSALYIWNTAKDSLEMQGLFSAITLVVIIIGLASLMAGIVGVGNIMLITVKERTREIGIRKALGAKPFSILKLIILESIMITTLAGYVGILIGVGITEGVATLIESMPSDGPSMFQNPTVNLTTVILATLFLILCGVIAGLIPAIQATRVSPIEAMRAE